MNNDETKKDGDQQSGGSDTKQGDQSQQGGGTNPDTSGTKSSGDSK